MPRSAVAVLDIGKTNAKLALVDRESGAIVDRVATPNTVVRGDVYPHYDVERLAAFLFDGLAAFARNAAIEVISTTTHGAAVALVDGEGLVLPILDYEHPGPDAVAQAYRSLRGDFWETFSPDLPAGLNVGRQLYWLEETFPAAFDRASAILLYPQYWVWRLCGALVCEPTSLGCHTDLWNPRAGGFSRLAVDRGWARRIPPLVHPSDTAGPIRPELADRLGLPRGCRVVAGIHDSNASLLPHIVARRPPFAVLSSGTWLIHFAVGGSIEGLDPARDCLANTDAFGRPVPSARYMAGREYDILTGGLRGEPTPAEIARVVAAGIMALPSFAGRTGPFGLGEGRWTVDPATLSAGERIAAASLYSALVSTTCLALTGADGPSIVEGPVSRNAVYLAALARLTGRPVIARPDATGTTEGAALLAAGPRAAPPPLDDPAPVAPLPIDLSAYAAAWRRAAEEG